MSTYTAIELAEIIEKHRKWLDRADGGERANLNGANLYNASLRNANLVGANLINANLHNANLSGANLRNANLSGANLYNANLHNANLSGANLHNANLRNANLSGANLYNANLHNASLNDADLSGANLYNANLNDADLSGANLDGARLRGTSGNRREVKAMQCNMWFVTYTAETMQIGCQQHGITDWWAFLDDEISSMDDGALAWWAVWKPILQQIIKASPAVSQLRKATLAKARGETE